ncbi:MAG TPA: bifunctional oligoribonuclease/PAP phosphatase NrnA [Candidatus Dormibacteraeota bacterium]|nr:bifunctional oligoribonuclease/PAP phosphatase NrnA [Candidatus Dormibacteraeota bacterium]
MDVDELGRIREVVDTHSEFLCVGHKDADADSLGSALAFADHLESLGKHVVVTVPDPLPLNLSYLPGYPRVNRAEAPADAVVVAFDAGSPSRFGSLGPRIQRAPLTVLFDHHASNEGFGELSIVDREAAATGVIVFEVLKQWGAAITPDAATNLYAAIFTDTGGFRHDNTTAKVLRLGAELAELGADVGWVALKSYKSRPQSTLRLQALSASAARYELEGRLIWSEVTAEMLEAAGAKMEETEGIIDVLQSLDTMECALLFKQEGPRLSKVSVRTRGDLAAYAVVGEIGGGGHFRAAGAEVEMTLREVESIVLSKVRAEMTGGVSS